MPEADRDETIVNCLLGFTQSVPPGELIPTVVPEASALVIDDPFAFVLATCLDRGTRAEIIWTIPHDMKNYLGHLDPGRLAVTPEDKIEACLRALPRKPRYLSAGARTVREISELVVRDFDGDASRIWRDRLAADVQAPFASVHGVGPGIASMAVLLLERVFGIRFSDLDHRTMDIKPDVHTVRVLHRLGMTNESSEHAAITAARRIHPDYPGELDTALWMIGRRWCHARSPACPDCVIREKCRWARQGLR